MRRSLLVLWLLVVSGTSLSGTSVSAQPVDTVVVVARRVGASGGWPACGVLAVRGEVVFETIRVESGEVPARFVAVVQCPASVARGGVQRLTLSRRPRGIGPIYPPRAPEELARFYLRSHELAEAPADLARFLGERRHRLAAVYPATRAAGGWTHYGAVLSVRIEDRRIVEIRARLPRAMTCSEAARWMGFDEASPPLRRRNSCEWPGISPRHRLGPGLEGRLADGVFEVRRR